MNLIMNGWTNVDADAHVFLFTIQNITKEFLKKSKAYGHNTLPWINGDLQRLMKVKEHVLRTLFL